MLKKGYQLLFKALEWFAMICMVLMTTIVFTDVVLRYIFKQGFKWSQEVATIMIVWFAFIGIAIGVLEGIHMCIEMFTSRLPKRAIQVLESINYLLISAFGGLMIGYGVQIMQVTKNATLPATKLPSSFLYVILPISGTLVLLNGLIVAYRKFTAKEENDNA